MGKRKLLYHIKRINEKKQIEQCEQFSINQYMWDSKQQPKTYGWMGYIEDEGLFVKMVCEETNPKREYIKHKDPVYIDSAMEIFLAFPEEVLSNDCMYTNFEINANGVMLANYGKGPNHRQFISDEQYELTGVKATIQENKWSLEVLFPESYLSQICAFERIKSGNTFYCNFYKVCQSEEMLHFGSYSPIESEKPNFHLPICFAEAVIESQKKTDFQGSSAERI